MKEAKLRHKEQRAARWVGSLLRPSPHLPHGLSLSPGCSADFLPPQTSEYAVPSAGNAFPSLSQELLFVFSTSVYELRDFSDQLKTLCFKFS